jgi:hypothetical protein
VARPGGASLAARDDGTWPFVGYRMTGLSDVEERLPLRPYVAVDDNL